MRIGQGFDIHRLDEGRKLVLAGVQIPFEKGLVGHSDGDVLTHAIIDALLGAATLGDIGVHFPVDDKAYAGANSMDLLKNVVELLRQNRYRVINIDATVFGEEPKLSKWYSIMRQSLADALVIPVDCVSVKAKTTERLGEIGAGLAIAAQAIVLIE